MSAFISVGEKAISQDDLGIVDLFQSKASWIWTQEQTPPPTSPGGEQRAFRKTYINTIPDNPPVNATVVIAVDNYFAMYVNGALLQIANPGNDWGTALAYNVPVFGDKVVLAIRAINSDPGVPNPAGVKAALKIVFQDGTLLSFYTGQDQSWLGAINFDEDWQETDFDDQNWDPAFIEVGPPYDTVWAPTKGPFQSTLATIAPPAPAPSCASSNGTTGGTLESSSSGNVAFPSSQFAGFVIGVVALAAVLAGIATFHFTRRYYTNSIEYMKAKAIEKNASLPPENVRYGEPVVY